MQTHFKKKKQDTIVLVGKTSHSHLLHIWESYFNQKPAVVSSLIGNEDLQFSSLAWIYLGKEMTAMYEKGLMSLF